MTTVRFFDTAPDDLFLYVVIVSRYQGQWVFCRHRERETYECPGGHREPGELLLAAARRELYEETGASAFNIRPVCCYGARDREKEDGKEGIGMLYYAEITAFDPLPDYEMAERILCDTLPETEKWTYPEIQPNLFAKVQETLLI